ncbi:MAG: VOC family protein, partial [Raoultibacter sp.]
YLYVGTSQFVELFYGGKNGYHWDVTDRAYNHVCFTVDDMDSTLKAIVDAGYSLVKPPKVGCDGNHQAWIDDPDGVRIEIMQLGPDSPQSKVIKG